ncbi:MAG: PEP-CTERM sorting domain-containing protein [Phycisphaerae bacterium]|nr:PEP-CTERM sorting domain-containing protein [Phycisphaerae bacterium]
MMVRAVRFCVWIALAGTAVPASAAWLTADNFNRADDTDISQFAPPEWTEELGDFAIMNDELRRYGTSLATFDADKAGLLGAGDSVTGAGVYVARGTDTEANYAGIVLGFADLSNFVVFKIQDGAGTGKYYNLRLEYGTTDAGWVGMTGGANSISLANMNDWFTEAQVRAELDRANGIVTVLVNTDSANAIGDLDDFSTPEFTIERGGLDTSSLGDLVGLAGKGNNTNHAFDNFEVLRIPEPTTLMLLVLTGIPAVLLHRRRAW